MADIDDHMSITAVIETIDNEIATFRVTTGQRANTNWPDLANAMKDFVEAMQSEPATENILGDSNLTNVVVAQWLTADSKYAQVFNGSYTGITRATDTAPMQCAVVVTSRVTFPPIGAQLQQYRNRFYVGPLASAAIGGAGKLSSAFQQTLADQVIAFDTALAAIPLDAGAPAGQAPGIAVTSIVGGHTQQADQIEVGNIIDTQRRRRNKLVETRVVETITL